MSQPPPHLFRALVSIAGVVGLTAAAFVYTAGWVSPQRLTPNKLVQALAPASGAALGHRRNHAKGICFTGVFESNGAGSVLSRATVFARGAYPALGRFNLGTANPNAPDSSVRVRGIGLRISPPDGQEWRSAMINAPFFAVSTPTAFFDLLRASANKAPDAMRNFITTHPEFDAFASWAKSAPWTASYAEETFFSDDSFLFVDATGVGHAVRWALRPSAQVISIAPEDLAKKAPDFLDQEITDRVRRAPARWTMVVTVASPEDQTADPSKAWPENRRTVTVGTLIVQQVQAEPDGPCRDVNFDPTILPAGITTSDDPFPAARSAAYRVSYDLRTSEAKDYPRAVESAKP